MARIAKETGMKGLCLDLEDYKDSGHLFAYNPDMGATYAEAKLKARQRGREWIDAIGKEYPDITLFCFFLVSLVYPMNDDVSEIGSRSCALFPAWLNGVYDGLLPEMTMVDGHEACSTAVATLSASCTQQATSSQLPPNLRTGESTQGLQRDANGASNLHGRILPARLERPEQQMEYLSRPDRYRRTTAGACKAC